MRTVNIGELKNRLSSYLQYVRDGEEVVIRDRNVAVARILPFRQDPMSERESRMVASGAIRMPEQEMDWAVFFDHRTHTRSRNVAVRALIDSRGDR